MANGFVVLREALALCWRHPGLWLTAALMSLPLTVVSAFSGALGRWSLIPHALRAGLLPGLSAMVLGLVQLLVMILTAGVVTVAVAHIVAGHPKSTVAIWRLGLGRIRPAITATLA